jgi:hypothetical protein
MARSLALSATLLHMKTFVRTVVTGFGLALGAALFRKVAKQMGLDDSKKQEPEPAANHASEAASDSELVVH